MNLLESEPPSPILGSRNNNQLSVIEESRLEMPNDLNPGGDVPVTMESMTRQLELKIRRVILEYDDNYNDITIDAVTSEFLRDRLKEAEQLKTLLREATLEIEVNNIQINNDLKQKSEEVRGSLIEFVKLGQKRLTDIGNERQETSNVEQFSKPGDKFKRQRVSENKDHALHILGELLNEINKLEIHPVTEAEYKVEEDKFNLIVKRSETVLKNAEKLIGDAACVGEDDIALELDKEHNKLVRHLDIARTALGDSKINLGVSSSMDALKFLDLKIPIFTGDSTETDIYTFIKSFNEFMLMKRFSTAEQIKILKFTSLRGAPQKMCAHIDSKEEIFKILKTHYGNPMILFNMKCEEIFKLGFCSGPPQKKREWALNVKYKLDNLLKLCTEHGITSELYFSKVPKEIEKLLPSKQKEDFRDILASKNCLADRKAVFNELSTFLDHFIGRLTFDVNYDINDSSPGMNDTNKSSSGNKNGRLSRSSYTHSNQKSSSKSSMPNNANAVQFDPKPEKCPLCPEKHTHMFYCERFQKEKFKSRFKLLQNNLICFRCLRLDSEVDFKDRDNWWSEHSVNCNGDFACTQDRCSNRPSSKQTHILVCGFHIKENKNLEDIFKSSLDQSKINSNTRFFSLCYQIEHDTEYNDLQSDDTLPDVEYPGIFMTQNVAVDNGRELYMFYDSGCAGAAINEKAYKTMKTTNVRPGPSYVNVAGGHTITIEGGDERFHLEIVNHDKKATITAIHMKDITSPFPIWDIQSAWDDIEREYKNQCIMEQLPSLPKRVGGKSVDILLGIRYNQYFPVLMFTLPCGLGVYKSKFRSSMGHTGVLGGPHQAWVSAVNSSNHVGPHMYLTCEARAYCFQNQCLKQNLFDLIYSDDGEEEDWLVQNKPMEKTPTQFYCTSEHCSKHKDDDWIIEHNWNLDDTIYSLREDESRFSQSQDIGSEITYRCVRCRNCPACRRGDVLEQASLVEEVEQALIESCISLDAEKKRLVTKLPFIKDPNTHLTPNKNIAYKVLESQVKLALKNPEMVADLEKAHHKLLDKGYAVSVESLSAEDKEAMDNGTGHGYVIPWRSVYKEGSLSTPCRMVYDASSRTPGGESLNAVLAKGANTLANLYSILLKFRFGLYALSTDVTMAYNGIQLDSSHFKYQKYLWKEHLDPESPVVEMVIKTLIYGVKPSGNLTIEGFKLASEYCIANFPEYKEGAEALKESAYMDDIPHSSDSKEEIKKVGEGIKFTLGLVSMGVKAFTYSGEDPPTEVSEDGKSLGILGMVWFPKGDFLTLDKRDLYLGKSKRGKRPAPIVGDISEALSKMFTRRIVHGKVAGVFDPLGLVTPITSKLKLDLNVLCTQLKLDWDDQIPDSYLETWVKNLERIQATREIKFRRAVVPLNAAVLEADLIVSVDASQKVAIAVVHIRFPLVDGGFSVQLVSAKSKLITTQTVPRAELKAACIGANLGHIVKTSLKKKHKSSIYITDSTIVLFWIHQDQRPLHTAVRNGVIDVRRFTSPDSWYHVQTQLNIADLGTRGKAEPEDINENSEWQQGKPWMKLPYSEMPIKSMEDIIMSANEKREAAVELRTQDIAGIVMTNLVSKVADRHDLSRYLPDPSRISFDKLYKCRAAVMRFASNMIKAAKRRVAEKKLDLENTNPDNDRNDKQGEKVTSIITFSDEEIKSAETYFMKKATLEVKRFAKEKDWKSSSMEKSEILYYTGRVLDQSIEDNEEIFLDINQVSFVKPILERYSPLAYSIMIFSHTSLVQHRNVSATLLESRSIAYIINGRSLAIEVYTSCVVCKRYRAKLLQVEMGKIHQSRLSISPAFFYSQVDIMGPFVAICEHNHRSSVNVYGVIFKCASTTAVATYVMQNYSAEAFIQAYTRHASRYGHAKKLFIDSGTQLLKACKDIEFGTIDVAKALDAKYQVGIEFEVCPVGAHNSNGMVERSIREIKKIFERLYKGLRIDILSYETAFSWISSELNNMPICLGSKYDNLGNTDLITPSRLLLGRNNRRAPAGFASIVPPTKLISQLDQIKVVWWKIWKDELLTNFVPQPSKWRTTSSQPRVGDLVMFLREGHERAIGTQVWRIGRIREVEKSEDGLIRHVIIEYKNESENVLRVTKRSVRSIAVLHSEEDLDLIDQLNQASKVSSIQFLLSN